MLPEITLVAGTAVDWPKFVTAINNALGRSPTRGLDDYALPVGSPASYVAAIAEFNRAGSNPVTAVKEADRTFAHLSFTFLVSADQATTLSILKGAIGLIATSAEPSRGRENLFFRAASATGRPQSSNRVRRERHRTSEGFSIRSGQSSRSSGSGTSLPPTNVVR